MTGCGLGYVKLVGAHPELVATTVAFLRLVKYPETGKAGGNLKWSFQRDSVLTRKFGNWTSDYQSHWLVGNGSSGICVNITGLEAACLRPRTI